MIIQQEIDLLVYCKSLETIKSARIYVAHITDLKLKLHMKKTCNFEEIEKDFNSLSQILITRKQLNLYRLIRDYSYTC